MSRYVRLIATFLVFTLCWNGFAHAARPSQRLALLQAAMQSPSSPPAGQPAQVLPPSTQPQAPASAQASPGIHDRLRFAHKLLLTQTGNDPNFAESQDATFNTILDALNRWGRYQIVTDVHQADLVIQLHGIALASVTGGPPNDPSSGSVVYSSSLQVTVADPHTLAPLWVVNVPVQPALRAKSQEKNLALLGQNTTSQLKLLAGDPLSRQEQAQLRQANSSHAGRLVWFAAGGIALTLGLFFIARHAAQQNQASFCEQHGITPCPGS